MGAEDEAFEVVWTDVHEIIGEMAWGVPPLPPLMVEIGADGSPQPKVLVIPPDFGRVLYEVIRERMPARAGYEPFLRRARRETAEARSELRRVRTLLAAAVTEIEDHNKDYQYGTREDLLRELKAALRDDAEVPRG